MRKTLALMEVLTLCQCGGSLQCLPKYVADGKRKRYHLALQSLEKGVDKIAIITGALAERNISKDSVSAAHRVVYGPLCLHCVYGPTEGFSGDGSS